MLKPLLYIGIWQGHIPTQTHSYIRNQQNFKTHSLATSSYHEPDMGLEKLNTAKMGYKEYIFVKNENKNLGVGSNFQKILLKINSIIVLHCWRQTQNYLHLYHWIVKELKDKPKNIFKMYIIWKNWKSQNHAFSQEYNGILVSALEILLNPNLIKMMLKSNYNNLIIIRHQYFKDNIHHTILIIISNA